MSTGSTSTPNTTTPPKKRKAPPLLKSKKRSLKFAEHELLIRLVGINRQLHLASSQLQDVLLDIVGGAGDVETSQAVCDVVAGERSLGDLLNDLGFEIRKS